MVSFRWLTDKLFGQNRSENSSSRNSNRNVEKNMRRLTDDEEEVQQTSSGVSYVLSSPRFSWSNSPAPKRRFVERMSPVLQSRKVYGAGAAATTGFDFRPPKTASNFSFVTSNSCFGDRNMFGGNIYNSNQNSRCNGGQDDEDVQIIAEFPKQEIAHNGSKRLCNLKSNAADQLEYDDASLSQNAESLLSTFSFRSERLAGSNHHPSTSLANRRWARTTRPPIANSTPNLVETNQQNVSTRLQKKLAAPETDRRSISPVVVHNSDANKPVLIDETPGISSSDIHTTPGEFSRIRNYYTEEAPSFRFNTAHVATGRDTDSPVRLFSPSFRSDKREGKRQMDKLLRGPIHANSTRSPPVSSSVGIIRKQPKRSPAADRMGNHPPVIRIQSPLVARQNINLEEREAYRQLLIQHSHRGTRYSVGQKITKPLLSSGGRWKPISSRSPGQPSADSYDNDWRGKLESVRKTLDDLVRPASGTSPSPEVVILEDEEQPSTSGASRSGPSQVEKDEQLELSFSRNVRRQSATSPVSEFLSDPKTLELNRRFQIDPCRTSLYNYEDYLNQSQQRRRKAERLEIESKLRKDDRLLRQKKLEDELRDRLRLDGLIVEEVVVSEEVPALIPLTDEQEAEVDRALSAPSSTKLVDAFSIPISGRDMRTLSGLNWLNDEVINFYMNLLMERGKAENQRRVHAFNTFFYKNIDEKGYASVKRWTRKVAGTIFSMDLILVPVHLAMHWCMAVIDLKNKRIDYYDSMGGDNPRCLNLLSDYLKNESKDKRSQPIDLSDWTFEAVKNIPQQQNGSDCGVFACRFAEYASRDANIDFSQEDMPYFRRRMVYEILHQTLL